MFHSLSEGPRQSTLGRIIRGTITSATVVLALATTSATDASAQTTLRVGKASAETFSFTPVNIGDELGIFEKHGLTIEHSDFAGGARLQQGLTTGAVDIGLGSGPQMASIAKGAPVQAVAMFMGPPAMLVLMANADSEVNSGADLEGKKVAVTQLSSLTAYLTRKLSVNQGWGPEGIELVPLGDDRSRLAALRTNQVDAVVITPGTALKFEEEGQGKIVARFGEYVKPFHNHVIYATNDIIENNPDAVRAFLAGWQETIEWMNAHREETAEMSKDIQGVDTDVALKIYDEAMSAFSTDLLFDKATLESMSEDWVEQGTLDSLPDVTTLYTEEFLN